MTKAAAFPRLCERSPRY